MSPEQAEMGSLDIDTRTDIYALGVLLYELLTGELPFSSEELRRGGYAEIQRMIREKEPPRPSKKLSGLGELSRTAAEKRQTDLVKLLRELRGDLDWIAMKAMEKDRTRRYATASELAADVGRHLRDEPVVARPPGAGYRLKKFLRKNRGPVAAAVVFLALLAGLAATTAMYLVAEGRRIEAEKAREDARAQNYLAAIPAAKDLMIRSSFTAARRILDSCPEGLRGWEWRHLFLRSNLALATLHPHKSEVRALAWSPDGKPVASASWDVMTCPPEIREKGDGRIPLPRKAWFSMPRWGRDGGPGEPSPELQALRLWRAPAPLGIATRKPFDAVLSSVRNAASHRRSCCDTRWKTKVR